MLRPFDIFSKSSSSVCIWLNGEPTAIQKRGHDIWNKAQHRVATDGALNEIHRRANDGVTWSHVVSGDFDSLDRGIELNNANMVHLPDQDKTDLTKSIEWCLEQKKNGRWSFDRIVLLGGLNGRFDHTMATISTLATFAENETPIIVLDHRNLVHAVPEGQSEIHVESGMITKMCGVIPLTQKATTVTSKGLKYDMNELPLAFGKMISTSNEVTSNVIQLKTTAPLLFTIELIKEL